MALLPGFHGIRPVLIFRFFFQHIFQLKISFFLGRNDCNLIHGISINKLKSNTRYWGHRFKIGAKVHFTLGKRTPAELFAINIIWVNHVRQFPLSQIQD